MVRDVNDFMAVGRPMHLSSPEVREREREIKREREDVSGYKCSNVLLAVYLTTAVHSW